MEVDDRTRLDMHRRLEEILGSPTADALMAHLPPVTWNEVATKSDLRNLEAASRADISKLRTEMTGEISQLRTEVGGEISQLRTEVGGEISQLRTEVGSEISQLRTEMVAQGHQLRGEISRAMERQIRWMVTFNTAIVAVALTAARLFL